MPEQRYIETYDGQGNLIDKEPYEVSDEELAREADEARLREILAMSHSAIPVPVLAEGFILLCKRLGYG